MIIFVGDKPSKKNIDPSIPFVGTQSYKTLLMWIWEMDLDISDIQLINKNTVWWYHVNKNEFENVCFISLGKEASKELNLNHIDHFLLPHPSGLNRQNNDKEYIKNKLKECKEWLNK